MRRFQTFFSLKVYVEFFELYSYLLAFPTKFPTTFRQRDPQKSNDATYLNLALNADFNILHFKYYMVLIEGIFQ